MEESQKISGKKKLPSIPSNYVTLVQLQERWLKQQEQKQKEENQELEQEEQGEKDKQVEERVNDEVDGRRSRKKGHSRRPDRESGKLLTEWKPKEEEAAADFEASQSEGVDKEKKGEKLKNNKKKWNKWRKNRKGEKAEAENEREEVSGTAANASLPASVECDKGKEEDEVHAPKQASAEKENVEARTKDRTVEIGRELGRMSMNGEIRRGGYHKYGRQNGGFNHRGGHRELNGSNYGKFGRLREPKQRNEGLVWVKKGEGSDGNTGGIQSSSCSAKELD